MANHGFSPESGPIAVMLIEHEQGRQLVRRLRAAGEKADQPWTKEEASEVVQAARQFIAMLGAHIQKEDNILYPMAQQHVPYTVMQNMGSRFDKYSADKKADGTEEKLLALAEELAARHAQV